MFLVCSKSSLMGCWTIDIAYSKSASSSTSFWSVLYQEHWRRNHITYNHHYQRALHNLHAHVLHLIFLQYANLLFVSLTITVIWDFRFGYFSIITYNTSMLQSEVQSFTKTYSIYISLRSLNTFCYMILYAINGDYNCCQIRTKPTHCISFYFSQKLLNETKKDKQLHISTEVSILHLSESTYMP